MASDQEDAISSAARCKTSVNGDGLSILLDVCGLGLFRQLQTTRKIFNPVFLLGDSYIVVRVQSMYMACTVTYFSLSLKFCNSACKSGEKLEVGVYI